MNTPLTNAGMTFSDAYSHATFCVPQQEFRCPHCHRLLWKGVVTGGSMVEMKCPRCKNEIKVAVPA